jgi:hypothetical protein
MIKDVINWNYERASWQWDVLCIVCLIFIFLTPKEWFDNSAKAATKTASATVQYRDSPTFKD